MSLHHARQKKWSRLRQCDRFSQIVESKVRFWAFWRQFFHLMLPMLHNSWHIGAPLSLRWMNYSRGQFLKMSNNGVPFGIFLINLKNCFSTWIWKSLLTVIIEKVRRGSLQPPAHTNVVSMYSYSTFIIRLEAMHQCDSWRPETR